MKSILLAVAIAGACSPALADTVRMFAQSPHNGTIFQDGSLWTSGGMFVSTNPSNYARTVMEFDMSSIPAAAGQVVVVHSARFEIYSSAIGPGGIDRVAFYGYEADGVVTGDDYGRGTLLERLTHGAPLGEYFGIDVTAWVQTAIDEGFDWTGFNVRDEGEGLSIVNISRDNIELSWTTFEYAPRLVIEYSLQAIPAQIPVPSGGALAGAGLVALAGRRRSRR